MLVQLAVLQDEIIFCKLEFRLTVLNFVCLPELRWASFKFNADCVSSLILPQLNFENTSCLLDIDPHSAP